MKIQDNNLVLKPDYCSNTTFKVESVENGYYKISDVVMPDKYITEMSCGIILNNTGNNLFKIEKNNNASYHIYLADSCDNRKYLKWIDDHFECVANISDLEENYLYEYYFEDSTREFIETDASYSSDGRFIESVKDSLLNETKYVTNNLNGLVTKMINPKGIETEYTYDNKNRVTEIVQGSKYVNYNYNNQNLLSEIIQGNKIYKLGYDAFLNVNNIKLNNINLVTNLYDVNKGYLLSSTYGNDYTVNYQYDEFDRINKIIKQNNEYNLLYNNNNDLHKITENEQESYYLYDNEKRLNDYTNNRYYETDYWDDGDHYVVTHKNSFNMSNIYDNDNNVIKKIYKLDYEDGNENNVIDNNVNKEGLLLESNIDSTNIKYTYDDLSRIKCKKIDNNYQVSYDYLSIGNRTSNIIKSIKNNNNEYLYKYDNAYNITDIYLNNNLINKYQYNSNDELICDYDFVNDVKNEYLYNDNGNILTRVKKVISTDETVSTDFYEYNNSNWEDLLTKYNNELISYDPIGNPINIGNKSLTWINGRQLNSYIDGDLLISYKYDMNGIRTEKNVNGIKTEYYMYDNNIIYEKTENKIIYYMYDNSGVAGLKYNNMVYYFLKNVQGDIIGILNSNLELIVKYEYDSFGNVLSIKDVNDNIISDEENIGIINPFRYRGYYYDKESELYYLNARYYNSKWGRFLNADEFIDIGDNYLSKNLFLYTNNNYINLIDKDGTYPIAANPPGWDFLKGVAEAAGAAGAAISYGVGAAMPYLLLAAGTFALASLIDMAISSAKSETLSCKKPQTVYNRAYVSRKTNTLFICNEELTYNAAVSEYMVENKNGDLMKDKNKLRLVIQKDCNTNQGDFKAIGYYTPNDHDASKLAKGISPVSRFRLNASSRNELIFVQHYHPVDEDDDQIGIHIWFGDYVITRR